jgi:orotidine-5'-phosphate decarboxylase
VQPFGDRVVDAVGRFGPLCVGIDPSSELLAQWGLPDDSTGVRAFGIQCVAALHGAVAVVKPQVAFFERHGAAGMAALEAVIAAAREGGLLVIADAKRGDVASTAEAYADAWFSSPLAVDALTVTPYVGVGALEPFVAAASRVGGGVIVLTASSNPEGRGIQEAVTEGGETVEAAVLEAVAELNRKERAGNPSLRLGSTGAVVGATRAPRVLDLAATGGVILAPGVGAQGATAADVAAVFAGCPAGSVLPSVSRGLLATGPQRLRSETLRLQEDLAGALG